MHRPFLPEFEKYHIYEYMIILLVNNYKVVIVNGMSPVQICQSPQVDDVTPTATKIFTSIVRQVIKIKSTLSFCRVCVITKNIHCPRNYAHFMSTKLMTSDIAGIDTWYPYRYREVSIPDFSIEKYRYLKKGSIPKAKQNYVEPRKI